MADDFDRPNGLAFEHDENQLYIVDSRRKHIRRFDVHEDATLCGGEVFATCDAGTFDGIRFDDCGRLWAAAHDGVHCFDPHATLLSKLHLPEIASNLTFGGPKRNDLFVTAPSPVYSLRVNFATPQSIREPRRPLMFEHPWSASERAHCDRGEAS